MNGILETISALVDEHAVITGKALRDRASSYWNSSPMPGLALVRPSSTEQLAAIMKACHEANQAVVVHGGLTGCVEGAIAADNEIIISLERMNAIEEIDPIGQTAVVQAGAILQQVQEAVDNEGLYLALDLGARGSCTIGGNVATNAGGINVIRYGMMRDQVLGLEAVLADGTIISSMNKMLKNNEGYDLKQLFLGTEGTLGIVTRIVLRLHPKTRSRNCAMLAINDFASVPGVLNYLQAHLGGTLCAYEVMWGNYFQAVTEPGWHRAPMSRDYNFYVLVEANGADPDTNTQQFMHALESLFESADIVDAVVPKSDTERRTLWNIREDFDAIIQPQPTFLYDVSLPIKFMEDYVARVKGGLAKRWPNSLCYVLGHLGDGNLHLFITPNKQDENLHAQADEEVYGPLQDFGGSISAEHGIGTEKKTWLQRNRSPAELSLMKTLKQALDPKCLLNRGKIFDSPH